MLSNKIKTFLIKNNIYSLESLLKLSTKFISTLKGYSEVKNELRQIIIDQKISPSASNSNEPLSEKRNQILEYNIENENPNNLSNIICIPYEIQNLPTISLLLISKHIKINEKSGNVLARVENCIPFIGELDGKTHAELLRLKNFGKKTLKLLNDCLEKLYCGSYHDLSEKYNSHAEMEITCSFSHQHPQKQQLECSIFLREFLSKHEIVYFKDITKIDEIDFSELTNFDRHCLLELRTLYLDDSKLITNTIICSNTISEHVIKSVEDFLSDNCTEREKEIALSRWNHSINDNRVKTEEPLNDIGSKFKLTRERVRQILNILIQRFDHTYIYDKGFMAEYFCSMIEKKLAPIEISDLTREQNLSFNENLYFGLWHSIINEVPFNGFIPRSYNSNISRNVHADGVREIYNLSMRPFSLILSNYLLDKSISEKLKIYTILFIRNFHISKSGEFYEDGSWFKLESLDNELYINHNKYSITKLIEYIFEKENRPLELSEIARIINTSSLTEKQYSEVNSGRNSLYAMITRLPNIINIDRYRFGYERHLSYHRDEWAKISVKCVNIIKETGHQVSASYLFKKLKPIFPEFVSKYELVHILKHNEDVVDLGFFNFILTEFGQTERLKVKDIVSKLYKKDPRPKHVNDVIKEIRKVRTIRHEGIRSMAAQWGYRLYKGNFMGLAKKHEYNLNILFNDLGYLPIFINYSKTNTSLIDIAEYFEIDNYDILKENITKIENHRILTDNFTNDEYAINDNWTLRRKVKTILNNNSEPMTINEVNWDLQNNYSKKQIQGILTSKDNLCFNKIGQKFTYININHESEELDDLMNQIEEYLEQLETNIELGELFSLAADLTDNLKSKNQFIHLLECNERIFIADEMVGIL